MPVSGRFRPPTKSFTQGIYTEGVRDTPAPLRGGVPSDVRSGGDYSEFGEISRGLRQLEVGPYSIRKI